jgi:hypothetical protein
LQDVFFHGSVIPVNNEQKALFMLQMIVIILVAIVVLGGLLWAVCNRLARFSRKSDLKDYILLFDDPEGCEEAFGLYLEGIHFSHMYGIPFPEVGCEDEAAFLKAAIQALERAITLRSKDYEDDFQARNEPNLAYGSPRARSLDRSLSDSSDKLIRLRADMARFKLLGMSEEERLKTGNTFITV